MKHKKNKAFFLFKHIIFSYKFNLYQTHKNPYNAKGFYQSNHKWRYVEVIYLQVKLLQFFCSHNDE